MSKKITKMYLYSDKETNVEKAREIGLSEKAQQRFMYALYEVEFEVEIDEETGKSKILKVDGKKLEVE